MTLTSQQQMETNVLTPTLRKASRQWLYWIVAAAALIILAIISMVATGAGQSAGGSLSPKDASPAGGKAIAEVLAQHGVTVTSASSMRQTREAATDPSTTTIFVVDDNGYLSTTALQELTALSTNVIIMTPTFDQLDELAPEVALAGNVDGTLKADCTFRAVQQAESVNANGAGFRVIDSGATTIACLSSGDDVFSLIQVAHGEKRVSVVGTRDAFSNEFVQFHGNAAFALGLLGDTPNLIWLLPSIDEAGSADGPTIAELTPPWVSSVMVLLALTAVAAAFWRGRRFGPLVVESLPVTVRASETMHGRARLYQKASDYLHALDTLRMGTIDRLSALCGLPTAATVDDVIRAVASSTGQQVSEVARIVRDAAPTSETELITLSDALLKLEAATALATRPSSATIDSTATATEPEGPTR